MAEEAGGEGGIRTLDTVARMPHFECGAFNRSATSPKGAKGSRSNPYLAAAAQRNKLCDQSCCSARAPARLTGYSSRPSLRSSEYGPPPRKAMAKQTRPDRKS